MAVRNFFVGLIARLMCCRGNKVEEGDERIDEISSDKVSSNEISLDELKENKMSKTKASFHLKAKKMLYLINFEPD